MEELQSMNELQIAAEKSWIIISTCIIAVMAVGAIVVLVWWFITNFTVYGKKIRDESNNRLEGYAAAADAGWSGYISMKDKYNKAVYDYEEKLYKMEEWDLKRINYIDKLRQQLRDNGIEPLDMDKETAA